KAKAVQSSSAGGKGGALSGGKAGNTGTYNYSAAVILGLSEGIIVGVGSVWSNKVITGIANLGLGLFHGNYTPTAWSCLVSLFPGAALTYRGVAYLAGEMALGTSPEIPNMNYEVEGTFGGSGNAVSGQLDAACDQVLADYLTNPHYGCGFSPAWVAD